VTAPVRPRLGQRLTPSERTVLVLIANGRTLNSIAREQHIDVRTVRRYRSSAFRQLGARNLADAIGALVRAGTVQAGDIATPGPELLLAQLVQAELRAERYRLAWLSARRRNRTYRRALNQKRAEQIWAIAHSYGEVA